MDNHGSSSPHPPTMTMKENYRGSFPPAQATGPALAQGHQVSSVSFDSQQPQPLKNIDLSRQETSVNAVTQTLDGLTIRSDAPGIIVKTGNPTIEAIQPINRESGSDDSQKADSSSELGTKPPSLDGKSITSGTTFALDEKESLRPDDSASVKAAGEDDDAFSIRGSLIAGSRMGSEVAGRTRVIQLGDMPERRLIQVASGGSSHGILTPQSTSSEQPPGQVPEMPGLQRADSSSDALNLIYQHAPDDKLIEAMASAKDRLFLLKLENEVVDFVQNSKEPYMDFPPSNSFCRMLTHKLADYYHMTHSFEPNIGSVRIFRTPFCRVPTSLTQWDAAPNPPPSAPPVILPKKIMRRGQEGNAGTPSAGPSKPTSEVGSEARDGNQKQQLNHNLTREEREEMYKLARERIFGTSEDSPAIEDAEADGNMSQASSVSNNNNRSNLGKRGKNIRHRRDDSDGFDSRNQYTQYWGPQQPTWVQQPPPAQGNQFIGAQYAPIYQGQVGHPAQPPAGPMQSMPSMIPKQSHAVYQGSQYPQPQQRGLGGGNIAPPQGSPAMHAQGLGQQQVWQQQLPQQLPQQQQPPPNLNHLYQPRSGPPGGPGPQLPPGVPYAFGQLPVNPSPFDPKGQHPIPGSYNRNHTFNPMTQSFIPGSNRMQAVNVNIPQPPFTAPTSHHGSPQIGSPQLAYPQYQQPVPQLYGGGYNMIRQASNSSLPGYHAPQHMMGSYGPPSHQTVPNQHHNPVHQMPLHPPHLVGQSGMPHQPAPPQMFNHLPTYGNPATLPHKPATGI